MPLLPLEHDLLRKAAAGDLVLFIGAGMSQAAGLPGWRELLLAGLKYATEQSIRIGIAGQDEIRRLLSEEDFLRAATHLKKALGSRNFADYLYRLCVQPDIKPTAAHRLLQDVRCAAILTTNFDTLIESSLPPATPVYTQRQVIELAAMVSQKRFAVVKVHGTVTHADTIILGEYDYRTALYGEKHFLEFFKALAQSRTILFLGCSLSDPDFLRYLDELNFHLEGQLGPHYALMRTKGIRDRDLQDFEEKYGIRVIGDDSRDSHPDIEGLLRELVGEIPLPQMDDIRQLIEESGYPVASVKQNGPFGQFDALHAERGRQKCIRFCYMPHPPEVRDFDRFRQIFPAGCEHVIIGRDEPSCEPPGDVEFHTRASYIERLADFSLYLSKLRADYDGSNIAKYYVPLRLRGSAEPLDSAVDEWLLAPGRNHLSLLGTFGTGKTWFCRRTAERWARAHQQDPRRRIPILFTIRDYGQTEQMEDMVTVALQNKFRIPLAAGFRTFKRLNDEGRLALIFDGFDEIDRRSDYRDAVRKFEQIARLAGPKSKVFLTCREEFFRHDLEAKAAHDVIKIGDRPNYDILYLAPFDDDQILSALRLLQPLDADEMFKRIKDIDRLQDLAHRPVLLDMLARTLPRLANVAEISLAKLYEEYTKEEMRRREYPDSLSEDDRLLFAEDLAWEMQKQQRSIPFSEFPPRVAERFGLQNDPNRAARFESDLRTQCYLQRDAAGNYEFAHLSMREYFVALRIEKLLRGEAGAWPTALTDAIVSFLPDLLSDYNYDVTYSEDWRMVRVPAGLFILGEQSENNLAVAFLEHDYWMDRYPVTNAEYCEFLNSTKPTDISKWIDFGGNRFVQIVRDDDKYQVRDGMGEYPTTVVTWEGAMAYAKHHGKVLPSAAQWEKAARGIDGRAFPFVKADPSRCNTVEKGFGAPSPVFLYCGRGESPYGCLDMAGNVCEWVEPVSPGPSKDKEVRGGSWADKIELARCAARRIVDPRVRNILYGFRCAVNA
jgi:hypothetical protein